MCVDVVVRRHATQVRITLKSPLDDAPLSPRPKLTLDGYVDEKRDIGLTSASIQRFI